MPEVFKPGDEVVITCLGKTVEGTVQSIGPAAAVLAVAPGALMIRQYDGFENRVVVTMDEKGVYRSVLDGITVVFRKKPVH